MEFVGHQRIEGHAYAFHQADAAHRQHHRRFVGLLDRDKLLILTATDRKCIFSIMSVTNDVSRANNALELVSM